MDSETVREYCSLVPLALALERLLEVDFYDQIPQHHKVLDLGSGDGVFARLALGSRRVISVEPLLDEIKLAKTSQNAWFGIQAWGSHLPIASSSIDSAVSNSVLEHIESLEPVIDEIARVLRHNGRLLVTLPTDQFERYSAGASLLRTVRLRVLENRYCSLYNKFWRHFHAYDPKTWVELFERHGFKAVQVTTYGSRKSCLANDLLAPLGMLGKVRRKVGYSWVLSPAFRRAWLRPITSLLREYLKNSRSGAGLVFLELKRVAPVSITDRTTQDKALMASCENTEES